MLNFNSRLAALALGSLLLSSTAPLNVGIQPTYAAEQAAPAAVHYRTAKVEGVDIFYREAGPVDAPVVLLLHGFPTSSHMFRNLIPALAGRHHVDAAGSLRFCQ